VPDAGGNSLCRLVEGSKCASQSCFFSDGNRRGGLFGARVGDDARGNARAIRYRRTLDSCPGLGHRRIARHFRPSLPEGRPAVARVGGRWLADGIADSQFRFLAQYQFSADHCTPARLVPGRTSFGPGGRAESLDASRPVELAVARDFCHGRHNSRMAAAFCCSLSQERLRE